MIAHWAYALAFFVLAATGVLLYSPDLRLMLTSGYSLLIGRAHRYAGAAAVPLLAAYGYVLASHSTRPSRWQRTHIGIVMATGAAFIVSGFLLWFPRSLPDAAVAASTLVHDIVTVLALVAVAAHLAALRAAHGR